VRHTLNPEGVWSAPSNLHRPNDDFSCGHNDDFSGGHLEAKLDAEVVTFDSGPRHHPFVTEFLERESQSIDEMSFASQIFMNDD
jgi:hypothetical protein